MRIVRGSNSKLKKLKTMEANADENAIIPLDLIYCGARHTRRWSSVNINVQNLDARRVFEEEMGKLDYFRDNPDEQPGLYMREYFLPPVGKKFGILDFSQIEPRCANWIVRNDEMLDAMRAGYGIYEAHAKATMRWTGQPGTLKQNKELYKYAKERVLSLGYGMGSDKFQATVKLKLGLDITAEEAKAQVDDFRATNRKIVGMWRRLDKLVQAAAMAQDRDYTLEMELPTGDKLTHFNVRSAKGGGYESYTIKGEQSQQSHQPRLWGGTLFENVTQRMARDILAEAILRVEDAGIPVVFHAHDELIVALDETTAEADFAETRRLMAIPPEWCADLPLSAEGGIFDHYVKMD
ncbi:MAG: DNA polymerase, partial [Verrucomicrobiota bacterium]